MDLSVILSTLDYLNIDQVTFPAHTFEEEYALSSDDKDYVTFHKRNYAPSICYKLQVCDYQTTKEPVHKDWYMTINYHS